MTTAVLLQCDPVNLALSVSLPRIGYLLLILCYHGICVYMCLSALNVFLGGLSPLYYAFSGE